MFVISATLALRLLAYVACAVTRIVGLIPLLHDEEAVAREAEVRVLARRLDGTVREQEVDARDADAEADLLRVRAAEVVLRRRRARQRLGKGIRKRRAARFEARRIDVRDVIADRIHASLMGFQAGHAGEKRTHHSACFLS